MSVTSTVNLPAQPATGSVVYRPLGGNGFTAPQAVYYVYNHAIVSDASGGDAILIMGMDPQYQCVVDQLAFQVQSQATSAVYRFQVELPNDDYIMYNSGSSVLEGGVGRSTWIPQPLFNIDTAALVTPNVDGSETYQFSAIIYLFNKRAQEQVPLNVLLGSFPRSSSALG